MLVGDDTGRWATVETVAGACARVERGAARQADSARALVAAAVRVEAAVASGRRATTPSAPSSPPRSSDRPAPSSAKPLRVLLVEDNDDAARAAWRALTREGFSVTRASAGDEALCMLVEQPQWDAVVADLHLGAGMLGTAVLREAAVQVPSARRIVWTAMLVGPDLETARLACEAHVAIEKGRSASILVAAIRGLEVSP